MGWKGEAAAIVFLTMAASSVSSFALADAACSSKCDNNHVSCMQGGKSDDGVCLPQWRQCKVACSGATKSVSPIAQPVKVTTTTTILPGAKGSKVVATKTVIDKH